MAREILQIHNRMPPDSITPFRHDELGIPWLAISPLWRKLRRISNVHLLARKSLDSNQCLRYRKIEELLSHVGKFRETGKPVNIAEAAFTTTLNLLGNTMFSMDLAEGATSESAKELKELIWQIMVEAGRPNIADYFPVLKRVDPYGAKRRMTEYFGRMFKVIDRIIHERRQVRAASGSDRKSDMLDILLDLSEHEEDMDLFTLKHLFLDLFAAGGDTTSSTLEWAMAELLRNPNKLIKAQNELKQVIGSGKTVEESDIARLPYLQATVKETFRMHPAVPLLLPRRAGASVEVGGYTVPEGAQVFVNVWAIGRDPAVWENPNDFIPERFIGSDIDVKGLNFEVLPFGGGRRICPGLPLAVRMLHLMLGSLLNSFDWKLEDGVSPATMDMGDVFGITLKKAQPLRAIPLPRKKMDKNMECVSLKVILKSPQSGSSII
ncbi:hypothetical protein SAY87_012336 [Trapa incisa]|uniref:Geraniol 10-hydroxylase n=1 Tax=Trapa incisa TaxID=236973 RepID=A0AAN7GXP7_9MYRT|nr:hypothetical protein SAY87_012336 [Trapa incisa]